MVSGRRAREAMAFPVGQPSSPWPRLALVEAQMPSCTAQAACVSHVATPGTGERSVRASQSSVSGCCSEGGKPPG